MSAIIGIRCDECGKAALSEHGEWFAALGIRIIGDGWDANNGTGKDFCPFCAARRKAKEQVEAAAK